MFAGLGDMGNSDAGLFAGLSFSKGNGVTLGSVLAGTVTLATENLPPYTPSGSVGVNNALTQQMAGTTGGLGVTTNGVPGYSFWKDGPNNVSLGGSISATFTGTAQGGTSAPVKVAQPTILMTIYIKL